MGVGMQVFAKWTQQAEVRYYPGVITKIDRYDKITQDDDDIKFYVVFDDGFEKGGLRWDDMIPVGMLEQGYAVNVEAADFKEGTFYPATLSAYPEFVKKEEDGG